MIPKNTLTETKTMYYTSTYLIYLLCIVIFVSDDVTTCLQQYDADQSRIEPHKCLSEPQKRYRGIL